MIIFHWSELSVRYSPWIGLRENFNRKPWIFPWDMGLSGFKFPLIQSIDTENASHFQPVLYQDLAGLSSPRRFFGTVGHVASHGVIRPSGMTLRLDSSTIDHRLIWLCNPTFDNYINSKNCLKLTNHVLKNMKVSWDDENPHIWKNKVHVPNHQPILHSQQYSYLKPIPTSAKLHPLHTLHASQPSGHLSPPPGPLVPHGLRRRRRPPDQQSWD